jgi:hypothetical protein
MNDVGSGPGNFRYIFDEISDSGGFAGSLQLECPRGSMSFTHDLFFCYQMKAFHVIACLVISTVLLGVLSQPPGDPSASLSSSEPSDDPMDLEDDSHDEFDNDCVSSGDESDLECRAGSVIDLVCNDCDLEVDDVDHEDGKSVSHEDPLPSWSTSARRKRPVSPDMSARGSPGGGVGALSVRLGFLRFEFLASFWVSSSWL